MNLFQQIAPRLSRTLGQAEPENRETEYTLKPAYEVKETPEAWSLTVYLPGVTKEGLEITAEEGLINITGRRSWQKPEGWTVLYRESADAPFCLKLEHDNAVDVDHIHAELKDGILRASLPKPETQKPRKISVN